MQQLSELAADLFGRFDDLRREFVLTTCQPPRPWRNLLFNRTFNIQPTQTGGGVTYRRDEDGTVILLNWSGQQSLYAVDLDSGEYFSLGGAGKRAVPDEFESRYGLGYQIVRQVSLELSLTLTLTVPVEGDVALYKIEIENRSARARRVRLAYFTDLDLNVKDPYHGTRNRFRCAVSEDGRVMSLHNASHLANRVWQAYLGSSLPLHAVTFEREQFEGVYGSPACPQHLLESWPLQLDPPDRPAFAAAVEIDLAAGQRGQWHLAFGCTHELGELPAAGLRWAQPTACETALREVREQMEQRYSAIGVQTPDATFDRFVNTWLQHQLAYNAYWNRGWGKGVRDGMQDAWAYLLIEPGHVRAMIQAALPHQFADGRTVRKWAPIDSKPYNDGGVWLALAVWAYICETGEEAFLGESFPFFQSEEQGSVLEHCFRAMKYLAENRGIHGLCLMPYGDWNDQLTGPGRGGKGESVWTTQAMAAALPRVAELARLAGNQTMARQCEQWQSECKAALQRHGWNGQWFSRAFDDEGHPLGDPSNSEGRIYTLPQAWAIIADIATPEQQEACLAAARAHLMTEHGLRLLAPSYSQFDPSVGQLSATQPGTVENGGNYCHASSFFMNALCRCGRVDEALDLFHRLLPTNPDNPPSRARQEPFSVTNCYRGPDAGATAGRSMFSWRTGAAGWIFRTAIEGILGVQATLGGLQFTHRLPANWSEAILRRRYRGKNLTIHFSRTGQPSLAIDGRGVPGDTIAPAMLREGSVIQATLH